MMFDEITRVSLLYDFYGELLTDRQKDVMKLYHEENLSLSEIADEFGISRQGVHDALKNAEKALTTYESKLGLVKKFEINKEAVNMIDRELNILISENDNVELITRLKDIKQIIDNISEQ
ncbi:MAG: YlxM family DNA-binding protein [Anaerovoracaceae bacterium]